MLKILLFSENTGLLEEKNERGGRAAAKEEGA